MISEGRVKLNGTVLTTPATVLANLSGVSVDGKPVAAPERTRLFAFHKPPGLITAERDPAGRPTIYNALINALPPGSPRLMPVGRLDFSTEGLLLLTNDGEFKRELELPSTGVPRTYRARTFGTVTQTQLEDLAEGVTVEGMHYGRIIADMERRTGRNGWVVMTLTEGKNREVRRVLEFLGLEVSRLIRTAYGPFHLGDLPRGAAVEIRPADLERFRGSLKTAQFGDMPAVAMKAAARPVPAVKAEVPAAKRPAASRPAPSRPSEPTGDRRAPGKPAPKRASPRRDAERDGELQSGGRRNAPGPRRGEREERGTPRAGAGSGAKTAKPRSAAPRGGKATAKPSPTRPGPSRTPRGKR